MYIFELGVVASIQFVAKVCLVFFSGFRRTIRFKVGMLKLILKEPLQTRDVDPIYCSFNVGPAWQTASPN